MIMISKNVIGIYEGGGGRIAAGGGLFAGGLFAGGLFAAGLIAGGLFAAPLLGRVVFPGNYRPGNTALVFPVHICQPMFTLVLVLVLGVSVLDWRKCKVLVLDYD